jgi:hypothetical protein
VGDLVAGDLGYGFSVLLWAGVIATIALVHEISSLTRTFCFWAAYILTQPPQGKHWRRLEAARRRPWPGDAHHMIFLAAILVVCLPDDFAGRRHVVRSRRLGRYQQCSICIPHRPRNPFASVAVECTHLGPQAATGAHIFCWWGRLAASHFML